MNKFIVLLLVFVVGWTAVVCLSADRSSRWDKLRDECVAEQKVCQWCGTDKDLEGHHRLEFSIGDQAKYELLKENVIVLCRRCHLQIGHNGNFRTQNPFVKEECEAHRLHRAQYAAKVKELEQEYDRIMSK